MPCATSTTRTARTSPKRAISSSEACAEGRRRYLPGNPRGRAAPDHLAQALQGGRDFPLQPRAGPHRPRIAPHFSPGILLEGQKNFGPGTLRRPDAALRHAAARAGHRPPMRGHDARDAGRWFRGRHPLLGPRALAGLRRPPRCRLDRARDEACLRAFRIGFPGNSQNLGSSRLANQRACGAFPGPCRLCVRLGHARHPALPAAVEGATRGLPAIPHHAADSRRTDRAGSRPRLSPPEPSRKGSCVHGTRGIGRWKAPGHVRVASGGLEVPPLRGGESGFPLRLDRCDTPAAARSRLRRDPGPLGNPRHAGKGERMRFEGFSRRKIRTSGASINLVAAGEGPPVLLLHGYPETHAMWHKVAPRLAREYTVVCPDLRGYGDSSKPKGLSDHSNYSKRAMALDMAQVMAALGHDRFHVVGHDRGGRIGHRLARDHGSRVRSLTVLDISPTLKMYESTNLQFAKAYYHWFFLIQQAPLPERMLAGLGPFYIFKRLGRGKSGLKHFSKKAMAEYVRAFRDPRTIHATCEDYRAAATIDLIHDKQDLRKKLKMPLLALWGKQGVVEALFDCLADWREVAADVRGRALNCGHFIPEEKPNDLVAELRRFWGALGKGVG